MISIIDYGMGNLNSVKRKLDRMGVKSIITSDSEEIRKSEKIILPGVGAFDDAISELEKQGLVAVIKDEIKNLDVRGCIFKPFDIDKIFGEIEKVNHPKLS